MKQKPACLATAVLLLAALTACGNGTGNADVSGSGTTDDGLGSSVTDEIRTDPATGTRYTGEVYDRVVRYGNGYGNTSADKSLQVPSALKNGSADPTGTAAGATQKTAESTNYQRMLENARVHDTDGFLLDGENAAYNTLG